MTIEAHYLKVAGERMVVLSAKDFERLAKKADVWTPPLPEPDKDGNYPLEAVDIIIARGIIRDRRRLGWTQAELARRARIRPETLNRIEQGKHPPSDRTMQKIDRALKSAKTKRSG